LPELYLGIDIRDEHSALTLLAKTWGGAHIVRSHWFRLYPEEGMEAVEDLFTRELKSFLKTGKVKPKEVFLSLPRTHFTVQSFYLPTPEAEALDPMIQLELDRHFPFPLESMAVSYHVVPLPSRRSHVIAAAAKKEPLIEYLRWLARSELKPETVDISLFSQMNLLIQNRETRPELQAIVDISSNRLDVSLIKGKTLITSRSIPISDENFKKQFFDDDISETLTNEVTENFGEFLNGALESTLYGCKSLESEESVNRIHLFGGGYGGESMVASIERHTGVKTQAALPAFLQKDTPLNFIPSLHMTALCLGSKPLFSHPIELNLHPYASQNIKKKVQWKSTIILSILILAVFVGFLMSQNYINRNTLASLNHQLEAIKPHVGKLQEIDQEHETLSGYMESFNTIDRQSPLKLPLLQELSRKLPGDTWVTHISIKQSRVEIQGYSASPSKLIPKLEESEFLKNTQFKGSVTTKPLGKQFTIHSTMEPRG